MEILFFEKPDCIGNARQKAILQTAGHTLHVENILEYPFTEDELMSFFESVETAEMFNYSAPAIKSGDFDPLKTGREQAVKAMLSDRLLIRRPLLRFENKRIAGFSIEVLEKYGIKCSPGPRMEILDKDDLETCPGEKTGLNCSEPRTLPSMD